MKLGVNLKNRISKPEFSEDARKAITLLYLEEAIAKEQYEDCAQLIRNAKDFGAAEDEIAKVIVQFLKKGKKPAAVGANGLNARVGRRRF